MIWTDDVGHHSWWTIQPESTRTEEIGLLLAGATGVSGGSAHTVPVLLEPTLVGRSFAQSESCQIDGDDEQVDGRWCVRVRVGRGNDRESTLWVDRESFVLRRLFKRTEFNAALQRRLNDSIRKENERRIAEGKPPFEEPPSKREWVSESTTHYLPRIDAEIGDAEFAFQPPVM